MAKAMAAKLGLKRKAVWLDNRTHSTLRDLCGGMLISSWGCPSEVVFSRLSERNIETRFGRLRSQFENSKMSVGDYWKASCMDMRRQLDGWDASKIPQIPAEKMLSPDAFANAASRAFHAALKLASLSSPWSKEELRSMLSMAQSCPDWLSEACDSDDEDEKDDVEEQRDADPTEIYQVIRDGVAFDEKIESGRAKEEMIPESEACLLEQASRSNHVDVKIGAATMELCENAETEGQDLTDWEKLLSKISQSGKFTLSLALAGHETFQSAVHDMYMLCCYLRLPPFGCDSKLIKNALMTRTRTSGCITKWHNFIRHQISVREAASKLPQVRTSRRDAWIESCEKMRKSRCSTLPSTMSVQGGQVVACWHGGKWHPGLLLAVWRLFKKGVGAQLNLSWKYEKFQLSSNLSACFRSVPIDVAAGKDF